MLNSESSPFGALGGCVARARIAHVTVTIEAVARKAGRGLIRLRFMCYVVLEPRRPKTGAAAFTTQASTNARPLPPVSLTLGPATLDYNRSVLSS